MNRREIYLDNAATTRMDSRVVQAMFPHLTEQYGNPSSIHELGEQARQAVEHAREVIAGKIHALPEEIIFTGSATEADNLAIKGIAYKHKGRGRHIITTKIEHKAVLESCSYLETDGFRVTYLDVDSEGKVSLEQLKKAIKKDTILVSICHANNEIGVLQDITAIGNICRKAGVYFHTDAAQSFTKVPLDVGSMKIDLMTLSGHKIHGPKGVGALYVRKGVALCPLLHGGEQEFSLRAGTENVAAIVGFAKAGELASQKDVQNMEKLRDYFIAELLKIPHVTLNGSAHDRLCNNINVCFEAIDAETMLQHLSSKCISASAGSACTAGRIEPSHVLKALGLSDAAANSSVRFSLSKYTTKEELMYAVQQIKEIVAGLAVINIVIINKV